MDFIYTERKEALVDVEMTLTQEELTSLRILLAVACDAIKMKWEGNVLGKTRDMNFGDDMLSKLPY